LGGFLVDRYVGLGKPLGFGGGNAGKKKLGRIVSATQVVVETRENRVVPAKRVEGLEKERGSIVFSGLLGMKVNGDETIEDSRCGYALRWSSLSGDGMSLKQGQGEQGSSHSLNKSSSRYGIPHSGKDI
jgi:hypothetical protein